MIDSILPPQNPTQLGEEVSWDPQRFVLPSGSRSPANVTGREKILIIQNSLTGGGRSSPPVTERDNDHHPGVSSSLPRAQSVTRVPARRPSLRRTKHLPARTCRQRVRQGTSQPSLSAKERTPIKRGATFPKTPLPASLEPGSTSRNADGPAPYPQVYGASDAAGLTTHDTSPPNAHTSYDEGAYPNTGGESRLAAWETDEGSEEEDEEKDEVDEYKTEGGEGAHVDTQRIGSGQLSPQGGTGTSSSTNQSGSVPSWNQTHLQDSKRPGIRQPYIQPPKPNRPPPHASSYPIPQGHNGSPSVARRPPTRSDAPYSHHPPDPDAFLPRAASFTTSRPRPQCAPEGANRTTWPRDAALSPPPSFGPGSKPIVRHTSGFSFNGDAATSPTEWGEGSEAGGSERRSLYSQQSNFSIYVEQQVARREEEAARREEEARRKEEDARGLEMSARRAFEWVQVLEARAGRIHDAAMQAEAQAKRRDAEIWEREAEVLRKHADTAKREVEVAKREIAAERAEQVARRKEREARRKEAKLRLKEEDVWRMEQEARRVEEDLHRKKMEIWWREEELLKREKAKRAAGDRIGTRDVVVAAWEKLKGRIGGESQLDKQNPNAQDEDRVLDVSSRNVEQWRSEIDGSALRDLRDLTIEGDPEELGSVSTPVPSEGGTSVEISAEYTVRSVHSYNERLHRSPAGYFRRGG